MNTRQKQALEIARETAGLVADVLHEIGMQVHDNPVYWAAYHKGMLESFSPVRRALAFRHKIRYRRATQAIKAHAVLAAACTRKAIADRI